MKNTSIQPRVKPYNRKRSGFTLVEILVAVGIMSLLLAIILVPLRLGFESYHIGTARAGLQQEAQLTMAQFNRDFQRASFVLPNSRIPDISDNTNTTSSCSVQPYRNTPGWNFLPYVRQNVQPGINDITDPAKPTSNIGISNPPSQLKAIANVSRIDMYFLRSDTRGVSSQVGEDYVVTYYPRRLNIDAAYDALDNPIVLFRAQYPYRRLEPGKFESQPALGSFAPAGSVNAQTDWTVARDLGSTTPSQKDNRDYLWLTHNYFGEANLEPLTFDVDATPPTATPYIKEDVIGSHTLAIPRGMQLVTPSASSRGADAYIPELSFVETSSDGKRIDRVTVNMTLAQYDQVGAAAVNGQGKAQRVSVTQTFDLPNAGCPN